jgi:hypothetical protein
MGDQYLELFGSSIGNDERRHLTNDGPLRFMERYTALINVAVSRISFPKTVTAEPFESFNTI